MTSALPYWVAPLYGLLAAAAILLGGGLIGPVRTRLTDAHSGLASMSAGFLFALGALGALPEAIERAESALSAGLLALGSFFGMLLLHRVGHGTSSRGATYTQHGHPGHVEAVAGDHRHPGDHAHAPANELSMYDAHMAVAGLALHSLLDGVAVSGALASKRELGVLVAVFVLLHKLPEGATAAALTFASGGNARHARRNVLIIAAASLLGAIAVLAVGPLLTHALAITAGVTSGVAVGIAGHLVGHAPRKALLGIALGILLFAATELLLHP